MEEIEGRQKREHPPVGRNPEDMSPPYRKHEFAPPRGGQGRNPLPSEDMSSPYEKRELSPPIGGRNPLPSEESREHPPIRSPVGRRPPIRNWCKEKRKCPPTYSTTCRKDTMITSDFT